LLDSTTWLAPRLHLPVLHGSRVSGFPISITLPAITRFPAARCRF